MIGLWVARFRNQGPITLWHRIESEIADRKVTHCGRQMGDIEGTVLAPLVAPPSASVTCSRCKSPG